MNIEYKLRSEDVLEWARNSLCDPLALTFSRCLAKWIDWTEAKFVLLGKEGLSEESLLDFRHGGKVSGKPRADDWLPEVLLSYGNVHEDFVLTEEWISRPKDYLREENLKFLAVFNDDEVYLATSLCNLIHPCSTSNPWGFVCGNQVPLFHGFLLHGGVMPLRGDVFDVNKMKELCKYVKLIFFGIYDGESYLICHLN